MKIGRNDPCPCGSGLKAKRCCLAPTPLQVGTTDSTPTRFFGYALAPSPFDQDDGGEAGIACLLFRVSLDDVAELWRTTFTHFPVGSWGVSTEIDQRPVVNGPFRSLEAASEFAQQALGVVRFVAAPESQAE